MRSVELGRPSTRQVGRRLSAVPSIAPIDMPHYDRFPLAVAVAGIALLPLLNPKGPANTAPVDVIMVGAIMVIGVWAGTTRTRLHVPYVLPAAGLAIAGLVAALAGGSPSAGGIAIVQEVFLLAWCAALTSLCRKPLALRTVVHGWCWSSTAWAVFLLIVEISGRTRLPGGTGGEGGRARLWFDHPNLAGNYFAVAIFIVLAARYPRHPFSRALSVVALFVAVLLTGSNTALLTLPVGGLIIAFVRIRSGAGAIKAMAVVVSVMLAAGAFLSFAAEPLLESVQETEVPLVKYSLGRGSRSASARESLFMSQIDLFRDGNLIGIGPSATRQVLAEVDAPTAKEAHNDYLATLVERGPLGVISLLALIGAVAVRTISIHRLTPDWAAVIPNPAALSAAAAGFTITAITHEVLHYRNLWTLLAIIAALYLYGRAD